MISFLCGGDSLKTVFQQVGAGLHIVAAVTESCVTGVDDDGDGKGSDLEGESLTVGEKGMEGADETEN